MTTDTPDYASHGFLIADDSPFLRGIIQGMLLQFRGRIVKHAGDGEEAIRILVENRTRLDCILSDWNMSPIDGLELLRSIRAGEVRRVARDICFIMLTGHADQQIVKAALALDVSGFLVKPVAVGNLTRAIDKAFLKKVTLKPPSSYKSHATIELPDTLKAPAKLVAPWILRSTMRRRSQEEVKSQIEIIRNEGVILGQGLAETKRPICHKQRLGLDDITVGKVLAEDLYAEEGALMLAAGTQLNESLLQRLRELAGDELGDCQLMVGDYAD